jgi:uncharacterized RDD family membrane protein YckC
LRRVDSSTPQSLDVTTPERVALALPVAGLGHRTLAYLIDFLCLVFFWAAAFFAVSLVISDMEEAFQSLSGLSKTLLIVGGFATQWLYWTLAEVFFRGQTPGKRLVRIRVTRADGSPVGVLESAIRNLLRWVDFLPLLYATGVVTMLVDRKHRRLGDIVAGTLLLREERIDLARYVVVDAEPLPSLAPMGEALSPTEVELILGFLDRSPWLLPEARAKLARAMVQKFGGGLEEQERERLCASPDAAESYLRQRAQARA